MGINLVTKGETNMKKSLLLACICVFCAFCGCTEENTDYHTQAPKNGSEAFSEASESAESSIDSGQGQFTFNDITLIYSGHIKSDYDYPRAAEIISLDVSRGTEFQGCLINDAPINSAASIQFVQSVDDGESLFSGYKGSIYTRHDNSFSYRDTYPEIIEDEYHGYAVCDSFSCEISEDKRQEFVAAVLAIMGNPKEITSEMCYDTKTPNEDGIMTVKYAPFNAAISGESVGESGKVEMIGAGGIMEISEEQYQEILVLFEKLRQSGDKYNWENNYNNDTGIPVPALP